MSTNATATATAPSSTRSAGKMLPRFYWPAWNRAFRACWEMDRGTVLSRSTRELPVDPELPSAVDIETIAERLRGPCRLSADHLRHACHLRALGRDRSSSQLTAGEVDRVVRLFDLLADPYSIKAVTAWIHPEDDMKRQLIWRVAKSGLAPAYLETLCRDRFGHADWRTLGAGDLWQFAMTVNSRARARARQAMERIPA